MRLMCDGIWIAELPIVHSKCSCSSMSTRDTKNKCVAYTDSLRQTHNRTRSDPKDKFEFFASVFLPRTRLTIKPIIHVLCIFAVAISSPDHTRFFDFRADSIQTKKITPICNMHASVSVSFNIIRRRQIHNFVSFAVAHTPNSHINKNSTAN